MVEPALNPTGKDRASSPTGTETRTATEPSRASDSYSRFVGMMRITLPLVALVIVVLVIAWPQLGEKKSEKFRLDVSKVTTEDSGGQQMVNARFTGTDSNGRPFTVTADTAAQQKKIPDFLDMAFPKADMTMKSGAWVALSAEKGVYDRKTEKLKLTDNVTVFHDSGYEFKTSTATVDLTTSSATGSEPIAGQGPGGTLAATGFKILDRGNVLLFTGKSRLVLFPKAQPEDGPTSKGSAKGTAQ